jgi:hypothetical protein
VIVVLPFCYLPWAGLSPPPPELPEAPELGALGDDLPLSVVPLVPGDCEPLPGLVVRGGETTGPNGMSSLAACAFLAKASLVLSKHTKAMAGIRQRIVSHLPSPELMCGGYVRSNPGHSASGMRKPGASSHRHRATFGPGASLGDG